MQDWDAIEMVADWLLHFRSATSQMSTTSRPMLSFTHYIFRGLQKSLKDKLTALPKDAPPELVEGLTMAHRKLSDYYYKYDESPFYVWAALLDPRFNYKKLRKDYGQDEELIEYLEAQKVALRAYFDEHYPASGASKPSAPTTASGAANGSAARPTVINFAALDPDTDEENSSDEPSNYFDAPRIPMNADPVQWWYARKAEFPRLYRLARDIMSIPGSAVAVERVFSGGRDTISLRRAQLKPETIRTLMLLKHHLRLKPRASFTSDSLNDLKESASVYYAEPHVKATAGSMFIGGADTTVSALRTFILAMLANPDAQRQAQAEIDFLTAPNKHISPEPDEEEIFACTDGSAINNGKEDAQAGAGIYYGPNDGRNRVIKVPSEFMPSNNVGEILWITETVESNPRDVPLKIISDSETSIDGLTKHLRNWEDDGFKPVKNGHLFQATVARLRERKAPTTFPWVKGHPGVEGNEGADRLAAEGCAKPKGADFVDIQRPRKFYGKIPNYQASLDRYETVRNMVYAQDAVMDLKGETPSAPPDLERNQTQGPVQEHQVLPMDAHS
ncbi:ribonuclease H-like domain-containing protein [Mycena sp. CBHHK59/15]|nr:ribonuclease H-like domain-containing protein [Mycena sp. CBHHK59/15]